MNHQNMTFGGIPTTCFRSERPNFFHNGVKPKEEEQPFNAFLRKMRTTVLNDKFTFVYNGVPIMAHPKWVRDHVYEMKGYKHWEYDLKKYLEIIADHQHPDGYFYEMVQLNNEYHTTVVDDCCKEVDNVNGLTFVRIEIEADVEFLVVEGVYTAYKASGDKDWLSRMLPSLERAINYCTSNPKRWDSKHQLVKRPFTIDTWDFAYDISSNHRMIEPNCRMCIMHGDNTGVYQAMMQLSWMCECLGLNEKARNWNARAATLKANLDQLCWNGNFYTHQIHLIGEPVDNLEEQRLSLSNTYAMTRGAVTFEQAQTILNEYRSRRATAGTFSEWFSINPPYEKDFNYHPKNIYVNGGIASLTAGELAHAAFIYSQEEYGWDIINRLINIVERDGEMYFLYNPLSGSDLGGGPSGWGAAAIIDAIDDGLAGIRDLGVCYNKLFFSPKWAITDMNQVKYITGYNISHTFVESFYKLNEHSMNLLLSCPSEIINCHILLPKKKGVSTVLCDGKAVKFKISKANSSVYADFVLQGYGRKTDYTQYQEQKSLDIELIFDINT